MGAEHLTMERGAGRLCTLAISHYERGMRKEDLRLAAGLTTNMIANMGKGEHISMKTLLRICEALNCDISDVIELAQNDTNMGGLK